VEDVRADDELLYVDLDGAISAFVLNGWRNDVLLDAGPKEALFGLP